MVYKSTQVLLINLDRGRGANMPNTHIPLEQNFEQTVRNLEACHSAKRGGSQGENICLEFLRHTHADLCWKTAKVNRRSGQLNRRSRAKHWFYQNRKNRSRRHSGEYDMFKCCCNGIFVVLLRWLWKHWVYQSSSSSGSLQTQGQGDKARNLGDGQKSYSCDV